MRRPDDVPPNLVRALQIGLVVQHALLLVDLALSLFAELLLHTLFMVIVAYILQVLFVISNILFLYFRFANTFAFKAGMIGVMVRDFQGTFVLGTLYCLVAVVYRGMGIIYALPCNGRKCEYYSTAMLRVSWCCFVGMGYYYGMHRALFQICDPRYYYDCAWIRKRMKK